MLPENNSPAGPAGGGAPAAFTASFYTILVELYNFPSPGAENFSLQRALSAQKAFALNVKIVYT